MHLCKSVAQKCCVAKNVLKNTLQYGICLVKGQKILPLLCIPTVKVVYTAGKIVQFFENFFEIFLFSACGKNFVHSAENVVVALKILFEHVVHCRCAQSVYRYRVQHGKRRVDVHHVKIVAKQVAAKGMNGADACRVQLFQLLHHAWVVAHRAQFVGKTCFHFRSGKIGECYHHQL